MIIYNIILIMINDTGQISVDLLLGISLFLLAFAFAIQFIPGLFISETGTQSNIAFTSYRTATILTEDSGWWQNSTHKGTDWENHISQTTRLGLAADSSQQTRLTSTPNLLNLSKIERLLLLDEQTFIIKAGLYDNVNGNTIEYGYNISILKNGQPLVLNNTSVRIGQIRPDLQDVYHIERLVLVETGNVASFDASTLSTNSSSSGDFAIINVSGQQTSNITLDITNFNTTSSSTTLAGISINNTSLTTPADYLLYKRNDTSPFTTYTPSINSTDTLRIILDHTIFNESCEVKIHFDNITIDSGGVTYYSTHTEPLYEIAELVVEVWR